MTGRDAPRARTVRLSIKTRPQRTTWTELKDFWVEADRMALWSAGWLFDHLYPIFSEAFEPTLESWTLLSALAASTERLRVGVMVSANHYRHPALVAKMAATVDRISSGRLELGLGAGAPRSAPEHQAYGIPMPGTGKRMDMLEEACQVVDGLLTQSSFSFDGTHYRLHEARCEPKPIQQPRPPLVIGGKGERRTLCAAARFADQWNFPSGAPAELREKIAVLRRHCTDVGRDPTEIEVSAQVTATGDPGRVGEEAAELVEAGAEHIVVNFVPPYNPKQLEPMVSTLMEVARL